MKRLHRAWAICLGCTLMLFVCGGLSVNAFSVTQPYVLAYGGFTNTQTSMINTIRALSYLGCHVRRTAVFPHTGLPARHGGRRGVFCPFPFAVFAASKTLAGFYLGGVLAGIGYGFGSMIPATILINRWVPPEKGPRHRTLLRKHRTRHDRLFPDPHGDLRNARAASLLPRRGRVLPRLRGAGLPAHPASRLKN